MGTKRRNIEDELSRFEAEISKPPARNLFVPNQVRPIIAANTYHNSQHKLQHHQGNGGSRLTVPPPPMPPPPTFMSTFVPTGSGGGSSKAMSATPVVLSSAPKLYQCRQSVHVPTVAAAPSIDINAVSFDTTERKKKDRKTVRIAGGTVWEDTSLADWPDDDFRIFCGDLGNDVNDEVGTRTFNKFPSFQRARVVRDKRTGKSKGFGFVSFREPADFIRAMKEMDGRYVGSRPIKLRKSTWRQRSLDVVKKKEREKQVLLQAFNSMT
ncbi:GD19605 [Drosophila simulans]|uniref:RNA-binding protein 42 n=1 Tax=Drosophila simulans TaxID=7240 RepID=B4QWX7_DROSI|nr:GD19605 [Drosophila simulans]